MAYDTELLEVLRADIGPRDGLRETAMFGGLIFMLDGHMLCGVSKHGVMYRVGKPNHAEALALPGVAEMIMTGRSMGGFVRAGDDAMAAPETRATLLAMALSFVATLPPKPPKS